MEQTTQTITDCLARLLLQPGVPLKAVAMIGGIIVIDAGLNDFGGGLGSGRSIDEIVLSMDRYDRILDLARVAVQEHLGGGDALALIQRVTEIKNELSAFESAAAKPGERDAGTV